MTEYEFQQWRSRPIPLWPRRLELLVMQLTAVLAQVNGNKHQIADFDLFARNAAEKADLHQAAEAVSSISGLGTRKLGQGRK